MINILTEKDVFISPNDNVSKESISEWTKNFVNGIDKTLENNNEAYLIKLHLSESMSIECLGAFVKQLKQIVDEKLDIPYIIVPVGSNCPVSDVTVSKIIKVSEEKNKNYEEEK